MFRSTSSRVVEPSMCENRIMAVATSADPTSACSL